MADDFYETIPVLDDFADAVRAENYSPLPDDWVVGFADVVGSTKAVADGRYKAVNMVGAGVIAAVANALDRRPFPFVFGGDGASFAVSAADTPRAAEALASMAVFTREELQMGLRVAMVPMTVVRAAGRDVRVGRYAASEHCSYAMFAGGGLAWVEVEAKRGAFALPPAPDGARPDLSDLSCRFTISPAAQGMILSVLVVPRGDDPRFADLVREVVEMATAAEGGGRPITLATLGTPWPGEAIALETIATARPGRSRLTRRLAVIAQFCLGIAFRAAKFKTKDFAPAVSTTTLP